MRLFVNPFAIWTGLAFKTGEAMLASVHAASARANAPRVAVIAAADAPPAKQVRQASKRPRAKAAPAKVRSKTRTGGRRKTAR
ncbi:MAG TPA: hypothetical protein VIG70_06725 [Burkholderiales bacterium]